MGRDRTRETPRRHKELILRALTDPNFRRELEDNPERVMGHEISREARLEIDMVLKLIEDIDSQIMEMADKLLCNGGGGGGCGIAHA